jgi:hypothetical protein
MVNRAGSISVRVVIVIVICIMDYRSVAMITISTAMMIISCMCTPIHANSHYRKREKIRRVISVIIRGIIGHISRRIYILHNWHGFNYHSGGGCRLSFRDRLVTCICRVWSNSRSSCGFGFNNIIFSVQVFISHNLQSDFFVFIL